MSLKNKLNAAMNKAKQYKGGPGDGIAKKASGSTTSKTTSTPSTTSTPAAKTAADYKAERKALRQQGKNARIQARNEASVERIKNREEGSGLKKVERGAEVAATLLGTFSTAKKLFGKKNNGSSDE